VLRHRMIVFLVALLVILVIALLMNSVGSSTKPSQSDNVTSTGNNSATTTARQTPTVVRNSQLRDMSDSTLQILAMCRGWYSLLIDDECNEKFLVDNGILGLGEPVTLMLTETSFPENYEHRFDGTGVITSGLNISMTIASFVPGSTHSLQVRRKQEGWSAPFVFQVDLLPPLKNSIEALCISEVCSPPATGFTKPVLVTDGYRYPFVEYISGVPMTDNPFGWLDQSYLWAELMLDNNSKDLGCINCDVAIDAGVIFSGRVRFMDSDVFYNWDLKHLEIGDHHLRVRLRNSMYVGPWSEEFKFKVVR